MITWPLSRDLQKVIEQVIQMFWEKNFRHRQPGKGSDMGACLEYSNNIKEVKCEWSKGNNCSSRH